MSADNESKFTFDTLLTESNHEEVEDTRATEEFLAIPVEECEESGSDYEDEDDHDDVNDEWTNDVVPHDVWAFDYSQSGGDPLLLVGCTKPVDFYELFMTDIWDLIVNETNRYGKRKDKWWTPTTVEEMKRFIGLCFQMAIVKLPKLRDYWSSSPAYGNNPIGPNVMPRDRFEKLLSRLHFADNASYNGQDNYYKIMQLVELVNRNCMGVYRPGKDVYIGEFLVPFRGKSAYRQYFPNKKQKYGIKLFKLCTTSGYTYKIKLHAGGYSSRTQAESVVMTLMDDLLDQGRHLYTDNRYSSVWLAQRLLDRKTHLIGRCGKNKEGIPKDIINQKLRRGEFKVKQSRNGITVLKWKDKSDIIMISTVHDAILSAGSKPQVIEHYNQGIRFMDTVDKIESYSPFVRKTSKWYDCFCFVVLCTSFS